MIKNGEKKRLLISSDRNKKRLERSYDTVAEWLKRQTRNLLGSPAQVRILSVSLFFSYLFFQRNENPWKFHFNKTKINNKTAKECFFKAF